MGLGETQVPSVDAGEAFGARNAVDEPLARRPPLEVVQRWPPETGRRHRSGRWHGGRGAGFKGPPSPEWWEAREG